MVHPVMDPKTPEDIEAWLDYIDSMTQEQCTKLHRTAPPGHPIFRSGLPLYAYFQKHFKEVGGMTPSLSKRVGW